MQELGHGQDGLLRAQQILPRQQFSQTAAQGDHSDIQTASMPASAVERLILSSWAGARGESSLAAVSEPQRPGSGVHLEAARGCSLGGLVSCSSRPYGMLSGGLCSERTSAASLPASKHLADQAATLHTNCGAPHVPPACSRVTPHGQPVWQAFIDDVEELEHEASPEQAQRRAHASWRAPAERAAGDACFATSYD